MESLRDLSPKRIVVVDDVESNLSLFDIVVRQAGFESITTLKSEEALRIVSHQQSGDIALLVLDVKMPGLSGLQLANQVSALQPSSQFLFVSGTPFSGWSEMDRKNLEKLRPGSFCLLPKPFVAQSLRECLDCRLGGSCQLAECPKHGLQGIE